MLGASLDMSLDPGMESQDKLLKQEATVLNLHRSQCMRKFVALQAIVIGLTAFLSMITHPAKHNSRFRLAQMHRILYDQFMLCQSYTLGQIAGHDLATQKGTWANKLHLEYNNHIHLL